MARKSKGRPARGTKPVTKLANVGPLPSLSKMMAMSPADFAALMDKHGLVGFDRGFRENAAAYLSRMTGLPPGSEQYQAALRDLVDRSSVRAARSMARDAYRQYGVALGGEGKASVQWGIICESDDASCGGCLLSAGEIGTEAELRAAGHWPGSHECGGNCRCEPIIYE